jgi:hypothetical protein
MNARLLVFARCVDSPVKVTLRHGQRIEWASPREAGAEGWSQHGWTLEHRGDHVFRESWSDGRDCDGRYGTEETAVCHVAELRAWDSPYHAGLPNWQHGASTIHDESAQAAGY